MIDVQVPDGWNLLKLSRLGFFKNGINKDKECFGYGKPFINLMNIFGKNEVGNNKFDLVNSTENELKQFNLKKGDVLFVRSSVKPEGVGLTSLVTCDLEDTIYSGFLIRFRSNDKYLFFEFKKHCFFAFYFRKELLKKSTISANTNINQDSLKKLSLLLPPLPEQKKIAEILSTWDRAIETLDNLIDAKTRLKKALMQQLLTGKKRFKDNKNKDYPEWQIVKLKKLLIALNEKSKVNNEWPVLTSSNKGLMLQEEYFGDNRLTERENIGFNVVPENYITYRSRSDNRNFTFNLNSLGFKGIISTYYPVFTTITADSKFIVMYLNYNQYLIGKYSIGTSQTVLSFNELCKIKLLMPSLPEQEKISKVLSTLDEEIDLSKNQLDKFKAQKKGLMQKLLTGKIRVKI